MPPNIVLKTSKNVAKKQKVKTMDQPGWNGLILRNQGGLCRKNPPWRLVEKVVREIDSGYGNSFCILEASGDEYVQALRGFNGYHLERRTSQKRDERRYVHYRACYPGASLKAIELKKHDKINSGEHRDLLLLDDVVDGFRSFWKGEGMTPWLEWRILEI